MRQRSQDFDNCLRMVIDNSLATTTTHGMRILLESNSFVGIEFKSRMWSISPPTVYSYDPETYDLCK